MEGNKHSILTDAIGRITDGWSDGLFPSRDTAGAILLREDGGYQFRLFENGEENPRLTDDLGAHCWRWENGQVRGSTEAEIAAEWEEIEAARPPATPTDAERIAELEAEKVLLAARVSALTDQNDFHEDLIVEMASVIYA